jgi:eukaryotic-like serine/threonine-protein kinase
MQLEKLGRYQIVRELGRGAMGVVYEATDPQIGRAIALKTVRLDALSINAEELAQRFKNEARAAGRLNHPNIVTIYDAGEEDGVLYIAMELLEGHTLHALLAERRLPVERAIDIGRQICAGLQFAHGKGIIHRDIKPGNVIVASQGFVKITDFGIARSGESMTLTGQVLGTPHYMSPEQVLGKNLDPRSDLFSVGVILYEMFTGERPFEGQSMTTVMYKIVHETPVPPRAIDTAIHPGLSAVIEKALAKSPELRYQNGVELAAALEDYRALDPAQVATAAFPVLSPDQTASVATPASAVASVRQEPDRLNTEAAASASVQPQAPTAVPVQRRMPIYLLLAVAVIVGLIWLGWAHYHRSQSTVATTPTSPGPTPGPPEQSPASQLRRPQPAEQPVGPGGSVSLVRGASPNKDTAKMTVNSSPQGAQIFIDGAATGKRTPAIVLVPKGEHTVALQLEGYRPSSFRFNLRGGEVFEFAPPALSLATPNSPNIPQVAIPDVDLSSLEKLKNMNTQVAKDLAQEGNLWQQWGSLAKNGEPAIMVSTQPPGARILLDGKDTGKKSPAVIPVAAAGRYRVQVELQGFQSEQRELEVQPRVPEQLHLILHSVKPTEHPQ